MKRLTVILIQVFAGLCLLSAKSAVFPEPQLLFFPGYESCYTQNGMHNPFKFYPVGWSKDSQFAYILFQDWADGIGNYIDFRVIVQNLITDEAETVYQIDICDNIYQILKKYGIKVKEEDYANYPKYNEIFRAIWKKDGAMISKKLESMGIIPSACKLLPFPYQSGGVSVNMTVETDKIDEDSWDYHKSYILWAESEKGGKKIIAQATNDMFLHADISGYLKNPYEDRIAVILLKTYLGFEGPPLPVMPFVFGCHLKKGFNK